MYFRAKRFTAAFGVAAAILSSAYYFAVTPHRSFASSDSAQGLLDRADVLSWGGRWAEAGPFYERAAKAFNAQDEPSKVLYAKVSEIPADESISGPAYILLLTNDLRQPEAQNPETRLRILTILGMIEINYNAALALPTWKEVEDLAVQRGHVMLATRAEGQQGIAAYILGDKATAKRLTIKAWTLAKLEQDRAATVYYAGAYGEGLVDMEQYKEALTPLNEAIRLAEKTPSVAYPTLAVGAKIEALAGLHQYDQGLQLANASLERLQGTLFDGEKTQVLLDRALIERGQGNLRAAATDCEEGISISRRIANFRGC